MTEYPVVWALSALTLGELTVLGAFAVITFMFMIVSVPLVFFIKALHKVILGWDI